MDSSDRDRIGLAKDVLFDVLAQKEMKEVPVLILANKNDLPDSISVGELTEKLSLH